MQVPVGMSRTRVRRRKFHGPNLPGVYATAETYRPVPTRTNAAELQRRRIGMFRGTSAARFICARYVATA